MRVVKRIILRLSILIDANNTNKYNNNVLFVDEMQLIIKIKKINIKIKVLFFFIFVLHISAQQIK